MPHGGAVNLTVNWPCETFPKQDDWKRSPQLDRAQRRTPGCGGDFEQPPLRFHGR